MRLSIDLISTDAFKKVNAKIHWPRFSQCKNFLPSDDEMSISDQYLECIIRVGAVTAHHPGGSCAIGKSPNTALDSQMRVRGVRKLRVVDASILPSEFQCNLMVFIYITNFAISTAPVSGTPHTAIAAIAEWASQIISYEMWFTRKKRQRNFKWMPILLFHIKLQIYLNKNTLSPFISQSC